jgi:leucyl aminopeptidase
LAAHVQAEQLRRIGIAIDLPDQALAAFLEGFALRAYAFTRYRTGPAAELADPIELVLVGGRGEAVVQGFRERRQPAVAGTHLARDLATEPANVLTPQSFAEAAQAVAQASGMMVEVLSDPELAAAGLEAFLAVGKGSPAGCRLAIVSWNGLPPVAGPTPAPVVLVGKGVTFDAGGITLKTGPGLEHNKWDMAGAAVVLGAMQSLAQRRAKVHAVGLMALAENMPSGVAMKPGDVLRSLSGQTVEVVFPDGEGRLILADTLTYACRRFRPAAIIDLATLTDEVSHVLGMETAGLISDDDRLAEALLHAASATGEPLWRLPLGPEYERYLASDIADMRNWGDGHLAATCIAGAFLKRFIEGCPWAHLDIAWTSWSLSDSPLAGRGATGFGVRLLDRFVEDWFAAKTAELAQAPSRRLRRGDGLSSNGLSTTTPR